LAVQPLVVAGESPGMSEAPPSRDVGDGIERGVGCAQVAVNALHSYSAQVCRWCAVEVATKHELNGPRREVNGGRDFGDRHGVGHVLLHECDHPLQRRRLADGYVGVVMGGSIKGSASRCLLSPPLGDPKMVPGRHAVTAGRIGVHVGVTQRQPNGPKVRLLGAQMDTGSILVLPGDLVQQVVGVLSRTGQPAASDEYVTGADFLAIHQLRHAGQALRRRLRRRLDRMAADVFHFRGEYAPGLPRANEHA
jgi:hypothetical protein